MQISWSSLGRLRCHIPPWAKFPLYCSSGKLGRNQRAHKSPSVSVARMAHLQCPCSGAVSFLPHLEQLSPAWARKVRLGNLRRSLSTSAILWLLNKSLLSFLETVMRTQGSEVLKSPFINTTCLPPSHITAEETGSLQQKLYKKLEQMDKTVQLRDNQWSFSGKKLPPTDFSWSCSFLMLPLHQLHWLNTRDIM